MNRARTRSAPPPAWIVASVGVALSFLFPGIARSQERAGAGLDLQARPRPEVTVERVSGITVDGRLDEAAWTAIAPITHFVQAQPDDGMDATDV